MILLLSLSLLSFVIGDCDLNFDASTTRDSTTCLSGTITKADASKSATVEFVGRVNAAKNPSTCAFRLTFNIVSGLDYTFSHNSIVDDSTATVYLKNPHDFYSLDAISVPGTSQLQVTFFQGNSSWPTQYVSPKVVFSENIRNNSVTFSYATTLLSCSDTTTLKSKPAISVSLPEDSIDFDSDCAMHIPLTSDGQCRVLVPEKCLFGLLIWSHSTWLNASASTNCNIVLQSNCGDDSLRIADDRFVIEGVDQGATKTQLSSIEVILARPKNSILPYWTGFFERMNHVPLLDSAMSTTTNPDFTNRCSRGVLILSNNRTDASYFRFQDPIQKTCYNLILYSIGSRLIAYDSSNVTSRQIKLVGSEDVRQQRLWRFGSNPVWDVYIAGDQTNLHIAYEIVDCDTSNTTMATTNCDMMSGLCATTGGPQCLPATHECPDGLQLAYVWPNCTRPICPEPCSTALNCRDCVSDNRLCRFCYSNQTALCLLAKNSCDNATTTSVLTDNECPANNAYPSLSSVRCDLLSCSKCISSSYCTFCAVPLELLPRNISTDAFARDQLPGRCVQGRNRDCPNPLEPSLNCYRDIGACTSDVQMCASGAVLIRVLPDCQFPRCPEAQRNLAAYIAIGVLVVIIVAICVACITVKYLRNKGIRINQSRKFGN